MTDTRLLRLRLAGWSAALLGMALIRSVLVSTPVSWPEITAWAAVLVAPPAVIHLVFRGPQSSIAQVLYDTEHPSEPPAAGGSRRAN